MKQFEVSSSQINIQVARDIMINHYSRIVGGYRAITWVPYNGLSDSQQYGVCSIGHHNYICFQIGCKVRFLPIFSTIGYHVFLHF